MRCIVVTIPVAILLLHSVFESHSYTISEILHFELFKFLHGIVLVMISYSGYCINVLSSYRMCGILLSWCSVGPDLGERDC